MRLYTRAVSYYRPEIPKLSAFLAMSFVAMGLGLLAPWPLAVLIDTVLAGPAKDAVVSDGWFHRALFFLLPASTTGRIVGLAVMLLVIKAAQELLKLASTMTQASLNFGVLMRVRRNLFDKFQSMTPLEHGKLPEGDAVVRLCYDANGPATVVNALLDAARGLATLASIAWLMFESSHPLAFATLGVLPVLIVIDQWYGRVTRKHSENAAAADTRMISGLQRTMGAITLVQAFGRQKEEAERFHAEVGESVRAWLGLNWQQVCYWLAVGLTFAVGTAVVFGYGGVLVARNQADGVTGGLTVGALSVFLTYLSGLFEPLCKVTGLNTAIASGAIATRRVFDVLDRRPPVVEKANAEPLPLKPRTLEFKNVRAAYDTGKIVLDGIDLRIQPGEVVALVGPSGGGKSTVLNLMARFFDPTGGAITFDGHDARDCKLNDVRRHMAVVPQEPILLPASIFENIAYGRPGASLEQVKEAARLAGASEFIDNLDHGYNAKVGREGAALSGGQKQRIAIARALLSDAPILVLDEPTSALDGETEKAFSRTIFNLRGLRSVIIVTHRAKPLTAVDRVYVLDNGRISETGTPRQLLAHNGWFARHYADGLVGVSFGDELDAEKAKSAESGTFAAKGRLMTAAANEIAPAVAALSAAVRPVADAAVRSASLPAAKLPVMREITDANGVEWPPTPLLGAMGLGMPADRVDLSDSAVMGSSLFDSTLSGLSLENLTDSAVGLPSLGRRPDDPRQLSAADLDDGDDESGWKSELNDASDSALIPLSTA